MTALLCKPLILLIENPLGKGEVVSSILTGSTRKANNIGHISHRLFVHHVAIAQNEARIVSMHPWNIRGMNLNLFLGRMPCRA